MKKLKIKNGKLIIIGLILLFSILHFPFSIAEATVTYDTTTTSTCNITCPTVVVVHTVGACTNPILVVGLAYNNDGTLVSVVATAGALASRDSITDGDGVHVINLLSLVGATGAQTVTATFSPTPFEASMTVSSYCGVDQATPHGTVATAAGSDTPVTVDVTSAAGEMVVDTIFTHNAVTADAGQTETANVATNEGNHVVASSREAGASTVTMSWTQVAGDYWGAVAIPLKAAAAAAAVRHRRPIVMQ